jgi:hypothetical protein
MLEFDVRLCGEDNNMADIDMAAEMAKTDYVAAGVAALD